MKNWSTIRLAYCVSDIFYVLCIQTLFFVFFIKIYVAGYDMSRHPFEAFQHMGFCPQADALWPIVTLQEHLEAYARIRGVPWGEVKRLVGQ